MGAMGIEWAANEKDMEAMETIFIQLGRDGLSMNHYDLAELTPKYTNQDWKKFLTDERVADYVNTEFKALQDSELRKIIINISDSNSVGKAQIINSLQKLLENRDDTKEGPAFVYCYIPLNAEQINAENVRIEEHDPFLKSVPTGGSEETPES